MRKTVVLAGVLAFALVQPAAAQNRGSDGEVISVLPHTTSYRDSDGDVISGYDYATMYRDSDGNVISVIHIQEWAYSVPDRFYTLETKDRTGIQVAANINADGTAVLPKEVSIDGLIYKVVASSEDELSLQIASRVNPVAFTLD